MDKDIKKSIERNYALVIKTVKAAPRSFVAETWFIKTDTESYFVKIVDKELFIPEIIAGLPALNALHEAGIERINWPIPIVSGEFYFMHNKTLVALFNFINARQSYDYSEAALGELLASIHQITPRIKVKIPEENYEYQYKERFARQFRGILSGELAADPLLPDMQKVLKKHEARINFQYQRLQELTEQIKKLKLVKVITHGDAGGNTLVKGFNDIFIIDWDGMLLAPAERDTWVPARDFLDGYRRIIPGFEPHPVSIDFYTLMYYFRSMAQYFAEIISTKPEAHRRKNLRDLEHSFYDGWMVPYLIKSQAY